MKFDRKYFRDFININKNVMYKFILENIFNLSNNWIGNKNINWKQFIFLFNQQYYLSKLPI